MNHDDAIRLFAKTLQNVERWMDKATAHAKAKSFAWTVSRKPRHFWMRCRSSANVCSVSGWDGAGLPPRYAAAYFAWSQADCTWRTNGY